MSAPLQEFLAIVRRDLGAEDARLLEASDASDGDGDTTLRCPVPGDREILVRFASPPDDIAACRRRLEMLVDSFHAMLAAAAASSHPARPPAVLSLQDELAALAERAGAVDALVIDARSPVVWGAAVQTHAEKEASSRKDEAAVQEDARDAARAEGPHAAEPTAEPQPETRTTGLTPVKGERGLRSVKREVALRPVKPPAGLHVVKRGAGPQPVKRGAGPQVKKRSPELVLIRSEHGPADAPEPRDAVSERAIVAVRALPEMPTLHKGGHLHASISEPDFGYVARSFAGIYVLVLVFREPCDELRAKRAMMQALPIVERLVLALPPLDPTPTAGVVALRRGGRRRR